MIGSAGEVYEDVKSFAVLMLCDEGILCIMTVT